MRPCCLAVNTPLVPLVSPPHISVFMSVSAGVFLIQSVHCVLELQDKQHLLFVSVKLSSQSEHSSHFERWGRKPFECCYINRWSWVSVHMVEISLWHINIYPDVVGPALFCSVSAQGGFSVFSTTTVVWTLQLWGRDRLRLTEPLHIEHQ